MEINEEALELHRKNRGKISIESKVRINDHHDLSLSYTPGVAAVCKAISKDKKNAYKYTIKSRTVAIITDGSAVLGLGDIGACASIPVMEGKAILFKEFAGINAFPICIDEKDDIVKIIKSISPIFGAINLEDIAAPRCFEIEEKLQDLGIPVMHDDQHGTAITLLAALLNACKIIGKRFEELKVVINGAGAAGFAIGKMLGCIEVKSKCFRVQDLIICDSKGIISKKRSDLNKYKKLLAEKTNSFNVSGNLADALQDADVFIGVSRGNLLTKEMIKKMNKDPVIFAMANPTPEITPKDAKEAGASIVGTGRSDYPNQINNVLAFPGVFKGALMAHATRITDHMKFAAAKALAKCVENPTVDKIIPDPLDKDVANKVADAVKKACLNEFEIE